MMNFMKMMRGQWSNSKFVCVGLDSDVKHIPRHLFKSFMGIEEEIIFFNRAIVDATKDIACAYKPNIAFYESHGEEALFALGETIEYIHENTDAPVILDAKRGDIGNTNEEYAQMAFGLLESDAITVHPYLGKEAMAPFLEYQDKGVFVLCRTSNRGAGEFQDMLIDGEPLYCHVARHVANDWNVNGNCGLVVGATYPEELRRVREIVGDLPILVPGIGAQGGEIKKTVSAARDIRGTGMIINSSRGIIFASKGEDFAEAARREAIKLHAEIISALG